MAKYASRSKGKKGRKGMSRGMMSTKGYFRRGGLYTEDTPIGKVMLAFSRAEGTDKKKEYITTLSAEEKGLIKQELPLRPNVDNTPDPHEAVRYAAIELLADEEVARIKGLSTDDEKNAALESIPNGEFKNLINAKMSLPADPSSGMGGGRRKSKRRKTRRRKTRR
jgi:hypothetical protein